MRLTLRLSRPVELGQDTPNMVLVAEAVETVRELGWIIELVEAE